METKNLLIEIGTEEIPAKYIKQALADFTHLFVSELIAQRLQGNEQKFCIKSLSTPRRMVLSIENVLTIQHQKTEAIFGPPLDRAKEKNGQWSKAALGFAEKNEISLDHIEIKKDEKGIDKIFVKKELVCKHAKEIIPDILVFALTKLKFPKSMRWIKGSSFSYARPLRSIVCILGKDVVPGNIENISFGRVTFPHRFLSKEKDIFIESASFADYLSLMEKHGVIVDETKREKIIREQILYLAKKLSPNCIETEILDPHLLHEVTNLTEYPKTVLGEFNKNYLSLPADVLITPMKHHQKYFPIIDQDQKLLSYFISITNGAGEEALIKKGNERVLCARLADAEFFFKEDTKEKLEKKLEKLKGVVYQKDLGTYYDKTMRMLELAKKMIALLNLKKQDADKLNRAITLSKIDLISHMVYEFPELQGKMGGHYAKVDGEDDQVCKAIYTQYEMQSSLDVIADILKIVDRLDTLMKSFSIGTAVSGSSDPYGLRRQAASIISLIDDNQLDFDLLALLDQELKPPAAELQGIFDQQCSSLSFCNVAHSSPQQAEGNSAQFWLKKDIKEKLMDFFTDRIKKYLIDKKQIRYDIVDAVYCAMKDFNVKEMVQKAQAISFLLNEQGFQDLMLLSGRVINILKQAKEKKIDLCQFDEKNLKEEKEILLHKKTLLIKDQYLQDIKNSDYTNALKKILTLKEFINQFFDGIMVMAEDEKLRNTRLGLLKNIADLFLCIADFSKIVD